MMRAKKAEKKRRNKKRGDGFDLINDDDGTVARLVEAMKEAAKVSYISFVVYVISFKLEKIYID